MAVRRRARTRLSLRKRIVRGTLQGIAGLVALTIILVLPLRWLPPLTSSFMLQNWLAQRSLSADVHFQWVPRERISRQAALAVLAAEDQKFIRHSGFDLDAIGKAWQGNNRSDRIRGGSTISQQVAKNLWLWPGRNWFRKGLEAWFTIWLEWLCPKERILEIYLNIAQFGPYIYGVEAAAHQYFRKPAARLNAPEAALLAAVLPNPILYRVSNPSRYTTRRQQWVQQQAKWLDRELSATLWPPVH
ncbi:MAG: monofunctional biosynthetic peptidoglycan transglycosylase [Gammaproteobacteria bacterium]